MTGAPCNTLFMRCLEYLADWQIQIQTYCTRTELASVKSSYMYLLRRILVPLLGLITTDSKCCYMKPPQCFLKNLLQGTDFKSCSQCPGLAPRFTPVRQTGTSWDKPASFLGSSTVFNTTGVHRYKQRDKP